MKKPASPTSHDFHIEGDRNYHNGKYQEAIGMWLKGAKMGNIQCMKNLSWAYSEGIGIEINKAKASEWKLQAESAERKAHDEQINEAINQRNDAINQRNEIAEEVASQNLKRESSKVYPNNTDVGDDDIVLLTQYYVDKDFPMREAENDLALKYNIQNSAIKKIILFLEEDIDIPFKSDKVERVVINDRMTYKDGFDYMRGKPGVKLMTNSDIYFDDGIANLKDAYFTGRLLIINRLNLNSRYGSVENDDTVNAYNSSDAWAWRDLPVFDSSQYLGILHCENKMLLGAVDVGIDILNVGEFFRAIHIHWSDKRHQSFFERKSQYGHGHGVLNVDWSAAKCEADIAGRKMRAKTLSDYIDSSILTDRIHRDRYLRCCDSVFRSVSETKSTYLSIIGYDGHKLGLNPYYDEDSSGAIMACSNALLHCVPKTFNGIIISAWEDNPVKGSELGAKVFATNVVGSDPMVVSIPLGSDFRSLEAMSKFSPKGKQNEKLMYVNFALKYNKSGDCAVNRDFPGNRTVLDYSKAVEAIRQKVFSEYENESWATSVRVDDWGNYPISRGDFIQDLYEHKFVLCPEGVGIDTFRIWDALYMKAIPIVKRSDHMLAFSDLPILFVDDFSGLTQDMLESVYEDMLEREYDFRKLEFSYWKNLIHINTKESNNKGDYCE